jgi:hypothetical protein
MQQMVRFKVEISTIVGGYSIHFGGQCHLFPDDQNIQKVNCAARLLYHSELYGRP